MKRILFILLIFAAFFSKAQSPTGKVFPLSFTVSYKIPTFGNHYRTQRDSLHYRHSLDTLMHWSTKVAAQDRYALVDTPTNQPITVPGHNGIVNYTDSSLNALLSLPLHEQDSIRLYAGYASLGMVCHITGDKIDHYFLNHKERKH